MSLLLSLTTKAVTAWPELRRPHVPSRCRGLLLAACLLLPGIAAAAAPPAYQSRKAPVQCWQNDNGQRVCGDVVPPSEARRQREFIDQRGMTRKVLPAQKSAAQAEVEAKTQREREQAEAYDRYLLQAYTNVTDIERARDDRLAAIDARKRLAEKSLADTDATLADLNQRKGGKSDEGEDLSPKLRAKIAEFNTAKADNAEALRRIQRERDKISADFARDILRYRELRPAASR